MRKRDPQSIETVPIVDDEEEQSEKRSSFGYSEEICKALNHDCSKCARRVGLNFASMRGLFRRHSNEWKLPFVPLEG